MSRRIVETGRLEVKGAEVRFKQKGTLEASDRNLADLERVFVRSTPSPDIRLFADFVFPGDVFRVWQDATLVNYKDFLEKVEMAGLENFRALIRHFTRAASPGTLDATSRAFAEASGPPERFANREELAEYDRALSRGDSDPRRRAAGEPKPLPERETSKKRAAAEEAWAELSPQLAEAESQSAANTGPVAGSVLIVLGIVTAFFSARTLMKFQTLEVGDKRTAPIIGAIAGGAALAMAFLLAGVLYLRRDAKKRPRPPIR